MQLEQYPYMLIVLNAIRTALRYSDCFQLQLEQAMGYSYCLQSLTANWRIDSYNIGFFARNLLRLMPDDIKVLEKFS